jgi:hypothetical protein
MLLPSAFAQETDEKADFTQSIFDDRTMIEGYTQHYLEFPKDIILEMIKDDTLSNYKMTAAVRVFNKTFAIDTVSGEKRIIERILLRRLNRTDSPFVEVEIMCTLCQMDRYRYYNSMVPALIQKLDHYNTTVNEMAFNCLDQLTQTSNNRAREARVVFNTLRKTLFLSRKRLERTVTPDEKLQQQLKLLRWSIRTLGRQELQRLPKEVMHLL